MSRKYVYHKKYVKFPVTNKTGKEKFEIKASFCKNVQVYRLQWEVVYIQNGDFRIRLFFSETKVVHH